MKQETEQRITSDQLHNANCFRYLRAIHLPDPESIKNFDPKFQSLLADVQEVKDLTKMDPNRSYGHLFTEFFKALEKQCIIRQQVRLDIKEEINDAEILLSTFKSKPLNDENIAKIRQKTKHIEDLKAELRASDALYYDFIFSIYDNDNHNLAETYKVIQHIPETQMPNNKKQTKNRVSFFLADPLFPINTDTPAREESAFRRGRSVIASTFTPQYNTNLPNRLNYKYAANAANPVKQLRMGTQAQRINNVLRVCPIYELWLSIQETQSKGVDHIYFNNLGLDRTVIEKKDGQYKKVGINHKGVKSHIEGTQEYRATKVLHELEKQHNNVAVITLPADKGLMDEHAVMDTTTVTPMNDVFTNLMKKTEGSDINQPNGAVISDFYISPKIKTKLFNKQQKPTELLKTCFDELGFTDKPILNDVEQKQVETLVFKKLLTSSFEKLGLNKHEKLSKAQQQAIWFHFIKFEVTNYIIDTLHPKSINFSCKDAIDRGAASSAYYNLIKSFELNTPINRDEFDQALQAASAMVKGRGMNSHLDRIWNTVDAYLSNPDNLNTVLQKQDKIWLIEWRDVNCPSARVNELLNRRIIETQEQSTNTPGLASVLSNINAMTKANIGNKKILLTAMMLAIALDKVTIELKKDPENKNTKTQFDNTCKRYLNVAKQLPVKSSMFIQLQGYLLKFLGECCYVVQMNTQGYKYTWLGEQFIKQGSLASELKQAIRAHIETDNDTNNSDETQSFLNNNR